MSKRIYQIHKWKCSSHFKRLCFYICWLKDKGHCINMNMLIWNIIIELFTNTSNYSKHSYIHIFNANKHLNKINISKHEMKMSSTRSSSYTRRSSSSSSKNERCLTDLIERDHKRVIFLFVCLFCLFIF